MNEYVAEVVKAIIWGAVGLFPILFGLAVHMWADIRSLKKAMNSAFRKIRALEGIDETSSRE